MVLTPAEQVGGVHRRSNSDVVRSPIGVGAPSTSRNCKAVTAKSDSLERMYMMASSAKDEESGKSEFLKKRRHHYIMKEYS